MKTYDAVVIGAGSVGVPLAYRLAVRGFRWPLWRNWLPLAKGKQSGHWRNSGYPFRSGQD